MFRITIFLQPEEQEALRKLAEYERRDSRSQAAFIIRKVLEQSGLLDGGPIAIRKIDEINAESRAC